MKDNNFFRREGVYVAWAIGLSVVGCFLLVASLFLPPVGIIDATVISAAGTVFVFAGSIVGIRGSFDAKLQKFEAEMRQRDSRRDVDAPEQPQGN